MVCWTLLTLPPLFALLHGINSLSEEIIPYVHVANNDQWMVLAHNRREEFHFIQSPYQSSTVIFSVYYSSFGIETVGSFSMSQNPSELQLIELVFIGRPRNSSEHSLFHAKLQQDEDKQSLSIVYLYNTSISSLSSAGFESLVGIHPLGTDTFVIGDRGGYVYHMNTSSGYDWPAWYEWDTEHYPRAISVSKDGYVFVGANTQVKGMIVPILYFVEFDPDVIQYQYLRIVEDKRHVEVKSNRAPMSMALRGAFNGDDFAWIVGYPSLDFVLIFHRVARSEVSTKTHRSVEKGINFGQSVILTDNNTYGVLSSALPTAPWSTARVQFYPLPTEENDSTISPLPLFVYPNNQQHSPYQPLSNPIPFDLLSLSSWTDGFGLVTNHQNAQRALLILTSPPGYVSTSEVSASIDSFISVMFTEPCIPGTYKSKWSLAPCQLCPPRTVNNGSSGVQCDPCDRGNDSSSSICFRGASQTIPHHRLLDWDQANAFPDSSEWTEFDDVLLNHVFKFDSISNPQCLTVSPLFWGSLAIGLGVIFFFVIILLGRSSKTMRSERLIKHFFTHLDLIGEGELWLGGLLTLAIVVLIVFTCKFSVSFNTLYPIESLAPEMVESSSCDSTLINAKFSSSLKLLAIRRQPEEKPIFDLLDQQNITLTVEFISTSFQCSNVSLQQNFVRLQPQKINKYECSYEEENDILSVSTILPQHLINVQFNLQGPFFVGGLRLCLSGPEAVIENGRYTVQSLDFCHFVYTPDQLLSIDSMANIEMTKVINRTTAVNFDTTVRDAFTGRWLPTWTTEQSSLWDSHIYTDEHKEYLRSLNWQLGFIVEMRETKFYMNNIQEPVARGYEIVFKTVLFSMLFLDLFGVLFLIVKMAFVPCLRLIQHGISRHSSKKATSRKEKDVLDEEHPSAENQLTHVIVS